MVWPVGTTKALSKSLDVYYRDHARTARMDRLNSGFVQQNDLVFDVGAHVGDRTASFRRLGARVVTIEPQAPLFRVLKLFFKQDEGVHLHQAVLGAAPGTTTLYVNSANPTVSTAARDMIEAAPLQEAWADQVWDDAMDIQVLTLDQLIAQHGHPKFVKIDVEGFEAEVLKGLSHQIPALSFEFTTLQRNVALAALERLQHLGPYHFNYSLGEKHVMELDNDVSAVDMAQIISTIPDAANSGDVYARLQSD